MERRTENKKIATAGCSTVCDSGQVLAHAITFPPRLGWLPRAWHLNGTPAIESGRDDGSG